jgi:hypothetical protein
MDSSEFFFFFFGGGGAVAGEGRSQLILNLMTTWFGSVYSEVNYAHEEEHEMSRGSKEKM